MVGTSKILTVSYGTFSCTLEGFDDPFAAMRTVAEYFRDLASEDRYFGAEPPQLDAEALREIAQARAPRQVTAQVGESGVTLRQLPDADAGAESEDAEEAEAGARPKPRRKDRAATKAAVKARVLAEDEEPAEESVAAKMDRIRAAIAHSRVEGYAEDEDAQTLFATAPIAAAFADLADAAERSQDAADVGAEEAETVAAAEPEAEAEPEAAGEVAELAEAEEAAVETAPEAEDIAVAEAAAGAGPELEDTDEADVAEGLAPVAEEAPEAELADGTGPQPEEPVQADAGEAVQADAPEQAGEESGAIVSVEVEIEETVELVLAGDASDQSLEMLAAAIGGARAEAEPDGAEGSAAELDGAAEAEAGQDADAAAIGDEALEWAAVGIEEEEPAEEVEAADLRDLAALDGAFDDEELVDDSFGDEDLVAGGFADEAPVADEEPAAGETGDEGMVGGGVEDDADSFPEARVEAQEQGEDGTDAAAAQAGADTPSAAGPEEEAEAQPVAAEAAGPAVADLLERLRKAVQRAQAARDAAAAPRAAEAEAEYAEAEIVAPGEMPAYEDSPPPRLVRARVVKMKRREVEAEAEEPDVLAPAVAAFAADVEAEEAGEANEALAEPLGDEDFDPFDAADEAAETFAAGDEAAEDLAAAGETAEDVATEEGETDEAETDIAAEAESVPAEAAEEHSTLSPEDEADLMAELAEVEAEADPRHRGRAAFEGPRGAPTSVTRILRETETQLDDSESSRRRSTIAHLKAAVAATRAEGLDGRDDDDDTDLEAYRDDLDRVVRPKRPPENGSGGAQRRLAPLMLVSEQRIDLPQTEPARGEAGPRRATAGNLALAEEHADEALAGDGDAEDDELLFADGTTFADYAGRLGATDLPDLMEAAAAYAAYVEGRPHFTRPQLMKQVADLGEAGFSREDGLRSFGTLLRQGRIEKLKRGQYTISSGSRFRPENLQPGA